MNDFQKKNTLYVFNATNYQDYPLGGALGTIQLFLKNTRFEPVLVGITNNLGQKIGKWTEIDVNERRLPFMPVANTKFNWIPHKILLVVGLLIHQKKIRDKFGDKKNINIILFVNREAYIPARIIFKGVKNLNVFFKMTEAGNPLEISERKIGSVWILQAIYLHLFIRPMLNAAKVIFSINDECRQFCEQHLLTPEKRKKIKDVHHYIDYENLRLHYEAAEVEKNNQTKQIVFWGRIAEVKGLDLVIKAVKLLKKENFNVQLIAIGDGSERKNLEKMIIDQGLQQEIMFPGRYPIERIAGCAKNSDVFVMASHTEGIPTSMLEAMTFGLPVVSTAVGGIPTLIKNGVNGYLVYERDPSQFSDCIKKALRMDSGAVKSYNTEFIKEGYSVESVVAQMDSYMEATL